jgi:hypothetical protein
VRVRLLIGHPTRKGPVFIGQSEDGRFHVVYHDEPLGSYARVFQAVEDAAGGHTFTPSDGTDLGSLGLSDDPSDWVPAGDLQ